MSRRYVYADVELPALIIPKSQEFREKFVIPVLTAVRATVGEVDGKRFVELELPRGSFTHAEISRDFPGTAVRQVSSRWWGDSQLR